MHFEYLFTLKRIFVILACLNVLNKALSQMKLKVFNIKPPERNIFVKQMQIQMRNFNSDYFCFERQTIQSKTV